MADQSGTLYVDDPNAGSGVPSGGQPAMGQRCPYLGLLEDPETCFGFPFEGNLCFGGKRSEPVALTTQAEVCLTGGHTDCLVYQVRLETPREITRPLPDRLGRLRQYWPLQHWPRQDWPRQSWPRQSWPRQSWRPALFLVGVLAVVAGLALAGVGLGWFGPQALPAAWLSGQPSSTVTVPAAAGTGAAATSTPEATATRTATPTTTLTPTLSPTPTLTPTPAPPTPGPALETPFGPDGAYVLHTVLPGESIPNLANVYDTTVRVLYAINRFHDGQALWPGRVLVIMPGQKDPSGLPLFEILQVEADTPLSSLAEQYSAQVELIRQYNDLGPADWVPAGRWLLIPVED